MSSLALVSSSSSARRVAAPRVTAAGREATAVVADSLEAYRQSISPIPVVSAAVERDLLIRAKQGDQAAAQALISANLKFVWKKARELAARGCGVPMQELISEGNLGLFDALEKYDLAQTVRFLTYADAWVRLRMDEAVSLLAQPVRVPQDRRTEMRKYTAATATLLTTFGRTPTDAEVAAYLNVSLLTLRGIQQAPWLVYELDAIGATPQDDGGDERTFNGGAVELTPVEDPTDDISDRMRNTALIARLGSILDPRELTIIVRYFGLDGKEAQTLNDIAELVPREMTREEQAAGRFRRRAHLGRERVRGLRNTALAKIAADPKIARMAKEFLAAA